MVIATLIYLSGSENALAQGGDAHWKQFFEYSRDNSKFVATKMLTKFEMPGDDGPVSGSYQTVRVTNLLGKAAWVLADKTSESEKSYKLAGMDLSLAARFADDPFIPFEAPSLIEQLGSESFEQISWTILRFRSKLKNSKLPVVVKVWLHPETGRPLKMEGDVGRLPLPGVKRLSFNINYGQAGNTIALRRQIKVHYEISLFFHSGVVDFSQELGGWEAR